jgi:DNA-directed RNA polymerase specialized sigma24 family protein
MSDPELFAVLVHRHAPAVQRYLTRRIGRQAAEDVSAETFLVAFRQRADYASAGRDCLPWLYGIATRLAHRYWRSETKQLKVLRPAPRLVPTQRRPGPRAEARAVPLLPVLVVAGASRWG